MGLVVSVPVGRGLAPASFNEVSGRLLAGAAALWTTYSSAGEGVEAGEIGRDRQKSHRLFAS